MGLIQTAKDVGHCSARAYNKNFKYRDAVKAIADWNDAISMQLDAYEGPEKFRKHALPGTLLSKQLDHEIAACRRNSGDEVQYDTDNHEGAEHFANFLDEAAKAGQDDPTYGYAHYLIMNDLLEGGQVETYNKLATGEESPNKKKERVKLLFGAYAAKAAHAKENKGWLNHLALMHGAYLVREKGKQSSEVFNGGIMPSIVRVTNADGKEIWVMDTQQHGDQELSLVEYNNQNCVRASVKRGVIKRQPSAMSLAIKAVLQHVAAGDWKGPNGRPGAVTLYYHSEKHMDPNQDMMTLFNAGIVGEIPLDAKNVKTKDKKQLLNRTANGMLTRETKHAQATLKKVTADVSFHPNTLKLDGEPRKANALDMLARGNASSSACQVELAMDMRDANAIILTAKKERDAQETNPEVKLKITQDQLDAAKKKLDLSQTTLNVVQKSEQEHTKTTLKNLAQARTRKGDKGWLSKKTQAAKVQSQRQKGLALARRAKSLAKKGMTNIKEFFQETAQSIASTMYLDKERIDQQAGVSNIRKINQLMASHTFKKLAREKLKEEGKEITDDAVKQLATKIQKEQRKNTHKPITKQEAQEAAEKTLRENELFYLCQHADEANKGFQQLENDVAKQCQAQNITDPEKIQKFKNEVADAAETTVLAIGDQSSNLTDALSSQFKSAIAAIGETSDEPDKTFQSDLERHRVANNADQAILETENRIKIIAEQADSPSNLIKPGAPSATPESRDDTSPSSGPKPASATTR